MPNAPSEPMRQEASAAAAVGPTRRSRGLKTQLATAVAAVVVVFLALNAAYLILGARQRLRQQLEEKAQLFARLNTPPLCTAFDTYFASGYFQFRQVALEGLADVPEVTRIQIVDVSGNVLFDSRELEEAAPPAVAGRPALTGARLQAARGIEPTLLRGRDASGDTLEIIVPWVEEFGRHRLSVTYRVSYASLRAPFLRSTLVTLAQTILAITVAALIGLSIASRITRPLASLAERARDIAAGRFERRLDVRASAELEIVAGAFNDMAEQLRGTVFDLRRSLERWRSLVEGAPVIVVSASPEGVVEFVNLASERAARFVGRSFEQLGLHEAGLRVVREVRETGQTGSFEIEVLVPGREAGAYLVHVGAVKEGGRVVGLTLVAVDETEKRRAAREREKLIAELEARNAELERFTYTVSHDLRSPLVTVRGFLGLLVRDIERADWERVATGMERMRLATETMDHLLRDLLDLSRIGRVVNLPERVPFRELAEDAVGLLAGRLDGVALEIEDDLPVLWGDRTRLAEVVQNLVDNSLKFMGPQPAPRIVIGARPGPGGPVCFVRDNGIGIAPEHRELVFGLFNRLDRSIEGTGVGLAVVRRVVEVHGGRVWVESDGPGLGSTLCFTVAPEPAVATTAGPARGSSGSNA